MYIFMLISYHFELQKYIYDLPIAKWAAKAVLSVVNPQILKLWTATIPSTLLKVSCTTLKLTSLGIPN